jgi:hypothetical protein
MSEQDEAVTWEQLLRRFPVGRRVSQTAQYPAEWMRRSPNKSTDGVVVGYDCAGSQIRVRRDGSKTATNDKPAWWKPTAPPAPGVKEE